MLSEIRKMLSEIQIQPIDHNSIFIDYYWQLNKLPDVDPNGLVKVSCGSSKKKIYRLMSEPFEPGW